jgi:hypothetical protein
MHDGQHFLLDAFLLLRTIFCTAECGACKYGSVDGLENAIFSLTKSDPVISHYIEKKYGEKRRSNI